jgi:hypothetical protein
MPRRTLLLLLVICLAGRLGFAQTTTTNCQAYGNSLNCNSTTSPSLQQQYDAEAAQLQRNLANLGAAIAQRRAQKAAQQAVWAAAATEQAKQAAALAQANYDATTEALSRFAADTTPARTAAVNQDLAVDWALLDGMEVQLQRRGEQGVRWDINRRWALTETPQGGRVFRMDEVVKETYKNKHISNYSGALRFEPESDYMLLTMERRPLYETIPPGYQSVVRIGTHAFASRMTGKGFDVTVPPGALDITLLYAAIAAMPGELPNRFRIWIVDGNGDVVPADMEVIGSKTVKEPVGPADGTCSGVRVRKEKREAVTLRLSAGTMFETVDVLAAAPHFVVDAEVTCRIVRRRPY